MHPNKTVETVFGPVRYTLSMNHEAATRDAKKKKKKKKQRMQHSICLGLWAGRKKSLYCYEIIIVIIFSSVLFSACYFGAFAW